MDENYHEPYELEDLLFTCKYRHVLSMALTNLLYILAEVRSECSRYIYHMSEMSWYFDVDEWSKLCDIANAIGDLETLLENFKKDYINKYNTSEDWFNEPFTDKIIEVGKVYKQHQKQIENLILEHGIKLQIELFDVLKKHIEELEGKND